MDEKQNTTPARSKTWIYWVVALAVIFALALVLRIVFREAAVFGSGWVRFAETDPWYHVRLMENLLAHFPHNITFDPYTYYPYGRDVFFAPLFDLLTGTVAWVIGLGSPSQHLLEVTAAYLPAVMGALVTIPAFFIGKELFNKPTGLICAALTAVIPGNFLARSLLGVTDHHVAEFFFSTLAALFLILAVKEARKKNLDFRNMRNWKTLRKPLLFALLFGFSLGIYMDCWVGGLLIVLIFFVFFVVQFIVDHLTGRSPEYLAIIGAPGFLLAALMVIPFIGEGSLQKMHPLALVLGLVVFILLALVSRFMESRNIRRFYYIPVLAGIGILGVLIFYFGARNYYHIAINYFRIFLPQGDALTITEVQPLFLGFDFGALGSSRPWGFFTTGLFFVPVAIGLLIYESIRKTRAEINFFLVWSILMLVATLAQNRFSYYFAVNVALFGGYIGWKMYEGVRTLARLLGFEKRAQDVQIVSVSAKKKKKGKPVSRPAKAGNRAAARYVSIALAGIMGFFLLFYPNILQAKNIPQGVPAPDDDWHAALLWMKDNTPDPFGDPSYYYRLYPKLAPGKGYVYPATAYGVMSWWDYGHWITAIAHRIPNSNAFQDGAFQAAQYFDSQTETEANSVLNTLGSKYVIIDRDMVTTKFGAIVNWTGKPFSSEYFYQKNAAGKFEAVQLFYPEYYKSICVRLYNFEGRAVTPSNTTRVISFAEKTDSQGTQYKEITSSKLYPTYEEAAAFVARSPGYIIVGTDPFISPVPLEKTNHYRLVYQSPSLLGKDGDRKVTFVEIFEYIP